MELRVKDLRLAVFVNCMHTNNKCADQPAFLSVYQIRNLRSAAVAHDQWVER